MSKAIWLVPILIGVALAAPEPSPQFKVSSSLHSRLRKGERVNVFLKMAETTQQVLQTVSRARYANRAQRLNSLHDLLASHADRTQKVVLTHLSSLSGVEFRSFWVTNQIFVRNADFSLVQSLEKFQEIEVIYEEIIAHIMEPVEVKNVTKAEEVQWGLRRIQVPQAWEELGLKEGSTRLNERIRIATIDTGVRFTHEALVDNFLGDYGWMDPTLREVWPNDQMGHGTHTTGTIAGTKGIGAVPFAQWMACRGCPTLSCSLHDLYACGEFLTCPTLMDGSNADCSKAPHLISNSWGAGQGDPFYNDVIGAWHAAGIIPIFSIGNFGSSKCGTAASPGDQNVIGVGSTTADDIISYFSSTGPTADGRLKPDIVSPGSNIISASHKSDSGYISMSGTSMACPHVSGIVGLLVIANPELTFEQAKQLIVDNADHDLTASGLICDGIPDNKFPNHVFGHGRVNALNSVRAQMNYY